MSFVRPRAKRGHETGGVGSVFVLATPEEDELVNPCSSADGIANCTHPWSSASSYQELSVWPIAMFLIPRFCPGAYDDIRCDFLSID